MLRTHRAGKGPGGCAGWGLGSRNRRGPGVPPTPGLRGRGPQLGSLQASWAGVGGAIALHSSPAPPGGPLPPASPILPLASFLCPQGPMRPGRGLEVRGSAWELSRLLMQEWARRSLSAPLPFLPEGPSRLPLLISLASGALILSCLHFSSLLSPPTSYQFTSGFLLSPWVSESPASGREMLTQSLPTPPS